MRRLSIAFRIMLALVSPAAFGSVVIVGTRVIYPSDARDVNIQMSNESDTPALVQVWIDAGDAKASPEEAKAPFILSPPLARIEPHKKQIVRLIYIGKGEDSSKETLFYFNALEIPPEPKETQNYLQFALRSRLKLLYRPVGLPGNAVGAPRDVQWSVERGDTGWLLKASNPSPFVVSLVNVHPVEGGKEVGPGWLGTLMPGGSETWPLPAAFGEPKDVSEVRYGAINDYGGLDSGSSPLSRRR